MFEGTFTAIVTPFKAEPIRKPAVDFEALDRLVEWQMSSGVSGFVVCGTTGESVTLDDEEKLAVTKRVIAVVNRKLPVIVGTGTNCTRKTIELTEEVKSLGADGALVVTPYYNKPTQEGLYQHFKAVAECGGLPVALYNVPTRTALEIEISTFERLAKVPNVVAVKQAVDSGAKLMALSSAVGDKLDILAGNCELTYFVMTVGGKGVISTAANIIPREMSEITSLGLRGEFGEALRIQQKVLPVINAVFAETNPIPVKAALAMTGHIPSDTVRLPLTQATEKTREALSRALSLIK